MKFDNTLMLCVKKDLEKNLIPMLLGEPGIGKSSWLQNLATLMHTKCFTLACNQLADKADLTGARLVPVTDSDGNVQTYKQVFYPHAVIHDAIDYAEKNPRETPILFMDELNRTTPDVTSEALSIPTLRAIGSQELPDNLRVVIAGNDKGNVTSLDEASISRFVLYHVEPDTQTFLSLDPEINPFVKNVLMAHPDVIFCKKNAVVTDKSDDDDGDSNDEYEIDDILSEDEMSQITTPRTIMGVSNWLNNFTNQELLDLFNNIVRTDGSETISALQEAIEGHVGHTTFSALLLSEIATNIMNTNTQANAMTVGKPACYDNLKQCPSMNDVQQFIGNMSEHDKSGCLLYALYEKEDNASYIQALASDITTLASDDMKTLMKLAATEKLDYDNVQSLLRANTKLSKKLAIILEN